MTESACNAGDLGLTSGLGRSPGEGNGNPLQYSCLVNPMDREAWLLQFMGSQRVRHHLATKQQHVIRLVFHHCGNDVLTIDYPCYK